MEVDDELLDAVLHLKVPDDGDPDFHLIACMNVTAEIQETTPAHLSPRKRIRIWSQHVREQH